MRHYYWYLLARLENGVISDVGLYSERHPTSDLGTTFWLEIERYTEPLFEVCAPRAHGLLDAADQLRGIPRSSSMERCRP